MFPVQPLVDPRLLFNLAITFPVYMLFRSNREILTRSPKNAALLIIVPTLIILPLQVWLSYDYSAYESGSFQYDQHVQELRPNETVAIRSISNWHSVDSLSVHVTPHELSVFLYVVDENLPDVRYLEQNCSTVYFRLPYLYTSFPQIANWSIYLSNPNPDETITVTLDGTFHLEWILDAPNYDARERLATLYRYPSKALVTLWLSVTLFALVTNSHEEELALSCASFSASIIIYLIILPPIGDWVSSVIDLLGFLLASTLVCAIFAIALQFRIPAKKAIETQDDSDLADN